jgi:hypothetical protein
MLASGGVDGWSVRPVVVPGETAGGGQELYKLFEFSDDRLGLSAAGLLMMRGLEVYGTPSSAPP